MVGTKIREEWIKKYLEKSGDDYVILDGVRVVVDDRHGFCTYEVFPHEMVFVYNVYGDGRFWEKFLKEKARQAGCSVIRFATRRNPKAFIRRFNAKLVGYILEMEV